MTADEPRLRVTTNFAFGICLILLGTALMLDRLQLVDARQILRFWPVALVLFGAALVIESFQRVESTVVAKPTGFNPAHIVGFVFVSLIASQMLTRGEIARTESSETVNVVAVMSKHQQVSSAPLFRGGELTSIMGRAILDLRHTTIAPGEEVAIEVFTLMGATTIYVPDGWQVDVRATPVLGGIRDRRKQTGDIAGAPRIVIRGFIMWGALDLRS